jgi:Leucine-rich repeat (LRR) protein
MLDLSGNQINRLPNKIFDMLPKLTYVYVNENKLTSFAPRIIKKLKKLKEINISSNSLQTIDKELFDVLPADCHLSCLEVSPHYESNKLDDASRQLIRQRVGR